MRIYVLHKNILDVPNDRSSHLLPTPRGGGVSFSLLFTISSLWLVLQHKIPISLFYALRGGILIAIIGWLDDVISIHAKWRAMMHVVVASWAVYWIGGVSELGIVGYPLAIVGIVWCINLYNFMDGIDGLASVEGIFISLSAALALSLLGISGISLLCLLLAGIIAGFLVWNWPPAKIFMGDVGSGYLGYVFSVLAIATTNFNMLSLAFWMTIAAVFLCDATFTMLYRLFNGERWYEAHRKHAYQRLVKYGFDHRTVTLGVLFINLFILFPVALVIFLKPHWYFGILSLVIAWLFILWMFIVKYFVYKIQAELLPSQ